MPNSKKVLITGASGFIGSCLLRRLLKAMNDIHIILRKTSDTWRIKDVLGKVNVHYADLNDAQKIKRLVKKIKPQIIYHLAIHSDYVKDSRQTMETDIFGTYNLLDACCQNGFEVLINTGSSLEYGAKTEPAKETDLPEPNNYYATAKTWQSLFCQHLARDKNFPIITLRLYSVYGPYEAKHRLAPVLIANCLKGIDLNLASPETARDFVFVEDVVDAYIKASQRPRLAGHIFNIGTGRQSSLKDIVSNVVKNTRASVKQNWGAYPSRDFDKSIWVADISKAKELLKWQPKHDLESGLKKTINWFRKNIDLYD